MAEAEAEAAVAIPIATLRPGDYVHGPNIPDVQLQSAGWVANFRSVRVHHSATPVKTGGAIDCKLRVDGLRSMARIRRDSCLSTFRAGADEHPRRGGQNGRTLAWPGAAKLP